MQSVINHLNSVIEDRMPVSIKPGPARLALQAIETQRLALGALRTLLDHIPANALVDATSQEAAAHGKRLIALLDAEVQRITSTEVMTPQMVEREQVVAPAKLLIEDDISDLA